MTQMADDRDMCLNCRIGKHKKCWRGSCSCCHGGK